MPLRPSGPRPPVNSPAFEAGTYGAGEYSAWVFEALGTRWEINTPAPLPAAARAAVGAELERIDLAWSRFRSDSVVAELARDGGSRPLADVDQPLMRWYRDLVELTDGAVTPLIGGTLDDAGYDADYSFTPAEVVRSAPHWDEVIADYREQLRLTRPALLDVGAAGKGFAVDRVAAIVGESVEAFVVDASGDLRISAAAGPVRVALEHPADPRRAIGVVTVADGSICASAGNRRVWGQDKRWHHIIDAHTARPVRDVVATWVLTPSSAGEPTMLADGLSTALFFTPASPMRRRFALCPQGFHHVTLRRNGAVEHTDIPGLELYL